MEITEEMVELETNFRDVKKLDMRPVALTGTLLPLGASPICCKSRGNKVSCHQSFIPLVLAPHIHFLIFNFFFFFFFRQTLFASHCQPNPAIRQEAGVAP